MASVSVLFRTCSAGEGGEQNRMDLLTVLQHEIGHLLGHVHEADGLMVEALAAGTRVFFRTTEGQETRELFVVGSGAGVSMAKRYLYEALGLV